MVNETDLELIEAYLDDALTPDEVERLDRRLNTEPELSAAMGALRGERLMRTFVWQIQQPADSAADRVTARVVSEVRRRDRMRWRGRWSRVAGAVAACILFGFVAGWLGRGRAQLLDESAMDRSAVHAISHTAMSLGPSGVYQVALTDDAGNVIAVQKFARYEEAKQFADDLATYEARRRQVQQGRAVLVSDQF